VSDKASKFMKSGSKSVRYGGAKAEGAAAKAASRSKGAVAKDFGKTAGKTASKSESKAYDLKGGGTTKEGPTGSRFNSNGSRKDAMVKPGQKDKVMSSMRDVKPSAAKKPTTMSAGTKRSSKEIAKDFGKQAKDNRPAAPSRPRMSTKEVGPTSRVSKSDVTHGRKKSSK